MKVTRETTHRITPEDAKQIIANAMGLSLAEVRFIVGLKVLTQQMDTGPPQYEVTEVRVVTSHTEEVDA